MQKVNLIQDNPKVYKERKKVLNLFHNNNKLLECKLFKNIKFN